MLIDQLIKILIIAVVQGVTEWLPVSSSGHLIIIQMSLGLKPSIILNVALHFGTLCVVLIVFRQDLIRILKAVIQLNFETKDGKMAVLIVVGSFPTGVIGYFFHDIFSVFFYSLPTVGVALVITGVFLNFSERKKGHKELGYYNSFLIGIAQGIAITPGISRSGITISIGLLRRLKRKVAYTYSFLLSIPAVFGATIYELLTLQHGNFDVNILFFGASISMIVGYLSLKLLLTKFIMKGKLHLFAYYCWTVGTIVLFYAYFNQMPFIV